MHLIVLILVVFVALFVIIIIILVVVVLAGGTRVPSHSAGNEIILDKAPTPGQELGFRMNAPRRRPWSCRGRSVPELRHRAEHSETAHEREWISKSEGESLHLEVAFHSAWAQMLKPCQQRAPKQDRHVHTSHIYFTSERPAITFKYGL